MNSPKRKWFIALSVIVLLGIAAFIFSVCSQSAVEKYKMEARACGEKPTYTDLVPNPQPDEAQYKRFTNAAAAFQSAEIHPGSWQLMKIVGPGRATVCWKNETLPEDTSITYKNGAAVRANPSPETNTWENFAAETRNFSEQIAELREILNHPAPDFHGNHDWLLPSPKVPYVEQRIVAQWFTGLTLLSVREGRLDEAVENIHALMGAQRLYHREPSLVSQMIRVAICGLAINVTWETLQADGWNDKQLEQLQREFESYDARAMLEMGFIGERNMRVQLYEMLSKTNNIRPYFRMMAIGGPPQPPKTFPENVFDLGLDHVVLPLWRGIYGDQDFLFGLRWYQAQIDRLRRAEKNESWVKLSKEVFPIETEFQVMTTNRLFQMKHLLSAIAIPNFSKASMVSLRNEVLREMMVTVIAIKRYELRHGQIPATIEDLVPEFLSTVPLDAMDGKPLKYTNIGGKWRLYSVGEDGVDDSGDAEFGLVRETYAWEEIFSASDAVWPHAVETSAAAKK